MNESNKIIGRLYLGYKEPPKFFGIGVPIEWYGSYSFLKGYEFIYSKNRIDIKTKHKLLYPEFSFLKEDVVSIDPYEIKTINTKYAIILKHKIKSYYPYIIFMFSDINSSNLIDKIEKIGFLNGDNSGVDLETVNNVRDIQGGSLKLTPFLKIYIILIIIFISSYFVFGWNFLNKILGIK